MTASLFDVLPTDERRAVLAGARRRKFKRGEVIFHEGDPGESLHVIDKGHVAIRLTTPLGDVLTLTVLGPGEAFGEQALLSGARRTASAIAVESAETRVLLRTDYERLRALYPAVTDLLVDVLAAQVRRLSEHLIEALHVSAETRIVRRLVSVAQSYDGAASASSTSDGARRVTDDNVTTILVPLTQEELATLAGTTRPTVNQVLQGLQEQGVVELGRGKIFVHDLTRLRLAAT